MRFGFIPIGSLGARAQIIASTDTRPSGAAAYWKLEEGTGTTAGDSSGNSDDGTISGATWVTGKVGSWALSFDGVDDQMNCNNYSNLHNFTAKTVVFWINLQGYDGYVRYVYDGSYWAGTYGDMCYRPSNLNRVVFYLKNTAGSVAWSPIDVTPNTWTLVGYTWDGSTVKFYKNGAQVGTDKSLSGTLACTTRNLVFSQYADGYSRLKGKLDQISIYRTALTPTQMQNIYDNEA